MRRIFINLDRQSAPGRFLPFGPRVIPISNYFQAALVLFSDNVLSSEGLMRVAADMARDDASYGVGELARAYQDIGRRGLVDAEIVERLEAEREALDELDDFPGDFIKPLLSRLRALAPSDAL